MGKVKRKTIAQEIFHEGIGIHKGQNVSIRLKPADHGNIKFYRTDITDKNQEIIMSPDNTFDMTRGTNFHNADGASVYTVEHFLSALNAYGITDLDVYMTGNELPICDGSAKVFLELLDKAGIRVLDTEVDEIVIREPVYIRKDDKDVVALPYDGFKITYCIRFEHTFLKSQLFELEVDKETYAKEIAPARTFGFDYEIEYLKKNNLALGGSLDNAIVIKKDGVLNPDGLRFEDEFVRHKILDIIGDMKVLNRPIRGHLIAVKSGHALDIEFAQILKNL